MFVSVVLDPGGIDSARALVNILTQTGFKKIQRACWEHMSVTEAVLSDLKKEIDRVTDYYDTVRIYQFPINGMFVITELKQKHWKRCQMKGSEVSSSNSQSQSLKRQSVRSSQLARRTVKK